MTDAPRNRVGCPACGAVIESRGRHDFVFCPCGEVAVDGGQAYAKHCFRTRRPVPLPDAEALRCFEDTHSA